jgi:hypothetical protein
VICRCMYGIYIMRIVMLWPVNLSSFARLFPNLPEDLFASYSRSIVGVLKLNMTRNSQEWAN